jgi:predicted O-methyltransferase YrrM
VKIFSVLSFINYILFSSHKRGHGVHSPFVYDFIIKVFRNKISPDIVFKVEKIRKKLKSDKRTISMTDFGTGSERRKNKLVKVSEIARKSSVPKRYSKILAGLSREIGKSAIVELGTSFGLSTMYMASANQQARVFTVEGCPSVSEIACENFKEAGLKNIELITGRFEQAIPEIENRGIRPGLVFIDGNHRKEPTINYFYRMADLSDENTIVIIDDIYCSRQMSEAWTEIKKDKRISLTIDIYRMGIVFFRRGMTRTDYKIRY